jgi:glycerol-3-phosphate O-acyltransferase
MRGRFDEGGRSAVADSGELTVAEICATQRFSERVRALAAETGQSTEQIQEQARGCLTEMVATVQPRASEVWDSFGRWLSRSYRVDAATEHLPKLRALSARHSLVFLPNHRSYLDPLVLRRALAEGGLPSNYILGGNNLAMWPATLIAKRSGLVFIRRSTRDDPIYPAMLRLYLGCLLQRRANLEWYFEGGRTRTGKLRPPRMGVLRYLVDAYAENREESAEGSPEVYIVPVSIVYDQQAEVGAISAEDGGGVKTPESFRWLVSFARAQSLRRGQAHVRFGEPLRLSDVLDDARERAGSIDASTVVPRVAFEIAHRINDAIPLTPSALATFALLDNEGRALTIEELLDILDPLLTYAKRRGLPMTTDVDLSKPVDLRRTLAALERDGVVEVYRGGSEPVYSVARDRQHEAAFYRNTVAHWFVYRAVAEIALLAAAEGQPDDIVDDTWQCALTLRDLLKFEFFFPRKREFAERIRDEVDLARPDWQTRSLDVADVLAALDQSGMYLSHRVIGPFLEAYSVAARHLADADPDTDIDEAAFVDECLGIARQDWLQHRLHSPESISRDLMRGALKLAGNRGLLAGADLRARREEFAAELQAAVDRVATIRRAALARLTDDGAGVASVWPSPINAHQ